MNLDTLSGNLSGEYVFSRRQERLWRWVEVPEEGGGETPDVPEDSEGPEKRGDDSFFYPWVNTPAHPDSRPPLHGGTIMGGGEFGNGAT